MDLRNSAYRGNWSPPTPIYLAAVGGTGVMGTIRPEYTGAPLYNAPSGLALNPAAYSLPPSGQWGNAGRNSITGPSQFSLNASLGRVFQMTDRLGLDFRSFRPDAQSCKPASRLRPRLLRSSPRARIARPESRVSRSPVVPIASPNAQPRRFGAGRPTSRPSCAAALPCRDRNEHSGGAPLRSPFGRRDFMAPRTTLPYSRSHSSSVGNAARKLSFSGSPA